jgi:hypothetical protein
MFFKSAKKIILNLLYFQDDGMLINKNVSSIHLKPTGVKPKKNQTRKTTNMAKNKTTETDNSVTGYLNAIADEKRRKDCFAIVELMKKQTGFEPKMWGTGIVGFGSYHYKYKSGHEGDAPLVAFASRANAISLYLSANFDQREELLEKFGKHKTQKGCIYVQKLEDIDTTILGKMVKNSFEHVKRLYPS